MRTEGLTSGLFFSSSMLFLLSGLASIYASVDRLQAGARFSLMALGLLVAIALWLAGPGRPNLPGHAGLLSAILAAIVATAYLFLAKPTGEVTAGALVILIPLGMAGVLWSYRSRNRPVLLRPAATVVGALALGTALTGLALTAERSAWLGLAAGTAVGLAYVWRYGAGRGSRLRWLVDAATVIVVAALIMSLLVLALSPRITLRLAALTGGNGYGRLLIWQDAVQLIQDYRFTGIGFGQTGMVLSSYVYLFHVPFLYQTYSLYLQIAVEQGLFGLIGFVGIAVAGIWRTLRAFHSERPLVRQYAGCTLAALAGMLVHGAFDAGLYAGAGSGLLFLPVGFAMSLASTQDVAQTAGNRSSRRAALWRLVGALVPLAAAALVIFWPGSRAALLANRAAVDQTRQELGVYSWPEWAVQDDVRRSGVVDMSGVIAGYESALAHDAGNSTANRRLGQVELSLGDVDEALGHLEAAYALAPHQRTTRQLLGEAYAISGDIDRAVQVWRAGVTDPHKLELRQAWYRDRGDWEAARRIDEALAQLRSVVGHLTR